MAASCSSVRAPQFRPQVGEQLADCVVAKTQACADVPLAQPRTQIREGSPLRVAQVGVRLRLRLLALAPPMERRGPEPLDLADELPDEATVVQAQERSGSGLPSSFDEP